MKKQSVQAGSLAGDLFGGLTAGIVALPLALAFGVASGVGAAAGLYGAIAVGILAAIFGGTRAQVSGPTGPMTVVVAGVVASVSGNLAVVMAAIVLSGLIQIAFGLLKLGGYIRYVPYPVVSGFMSGIGVIIITLQLLPLLGVPGAGNTIQGLKALPQAITQLNPLALALGGTAIALVYLSPRVIKKVPGTLVALLATSAAAFFLKLDVPKIGEIPSGLPAISMPSFDLATAGLVVTAALTLAALASIDSLLTSLVHDNMTRTRHDSDRELIGQGLGNTLAGLIGGIPGAGATMRTVVNIKSGGRGRLSGVIHGVVLLAILLGLGPLASHIPLSVLAGILITVGIGIIDYKGLRHFARIPKADAFVMAVVLVMTVFVDLIQAVGVGMVIACLIFVKRLSDMGAGKAAPLEGLDRPYLEQLPVPVDGLRGIYMLNLEGALFFGNAMPLQDLVGKLADAKAVVIRMKRTPFLDQSGAYALSDFLLELQDQGKEVYFAEVPDQPRKILHLTGTAPGQIPAENIFEKEDQAVRAAVANLSGRAELPTCEPTGPHRSTYRHGEHEHRHQDQSTGASL